MDERPRIGYFYSYCPKEILYAFGQVPVRILPTPADAAETEPYLHKNFCALVKVTLAGFLAADGHGACHLQGVIFSDICDAQRRLHDVWRRHMNIPVLAFLDLPRRVDSLGQLFYADALESLVSRLEAKYDQRLAAEPLAEAIKVYDHQRHLWRELTSAWVQGRSTTEEYYSLRDLRLQSDPIAASLEIGEAVSRAAATDPRAAGRQRILLMGSLNVSKGLVTAIEASGARIVGEDSACGERDDGAGAAVQRTPTDGNGTTREDLVRALAAHYISSPAPRLRDLPGRLEYLGRLARQRRVNAVVCSYYKFCDPYLSEFPLVKRFWEKQGLPVLMLEDEGEPALSGQARTRLEAFLEMTSS